MSEGKARIEETDVPEKMQTQAMEFDKMYGSGWQCVVGTNFGCFFTHTPGTFIYFARETLNFQIFKGATS